MFEHDVVLNRGIASLIRARRQTGSDVTAINVRFLVRFLGALANEAVDHQRPYGLYAIALMETYFQCSLRRQDHARQVPVTGMLPVCLLIQINQQAVGLL